MRTLTITISDRITFLLTSSEQDQELLKHLQAVTTKSLPAPGRPVRGVEREDVAYCPVLQQGRMVSLPRGLSRVLAQACRERDVKLVVENKVFSGAVPGIDLDGVPLKPRPYQKEIIDLLIRDRQGWVCLPCGGGKTTTGALAAIATGQATLVVVHTADLQEQWISTFRRAGVQARKATNVVISPGDVVVGIVNGLKDADRLLSSVGCLILDECFPAGTKIAMADGSMRNIESIRVGDEVIAYSAEGNFATGRVYNTMKRETNEVVILTFEDGGTLTCTPNHPIMTDFGWEVASNLRVGYMVRSANGSNHASMHDMRKPGRTSYKASKRSVQPNPASILQSGMLECVSREAFVIDDGGNESKICECKDVDVESDVQSGNQSKGLCNTKKEWAQASCSGRERNRLDESADPSSGNASELESGICCFDGEACSRTANRLQNRLGKSRDEDGVRGRWRFARNLGKKGGGREKDDVFEVAGMDGRPDHKYARIVNIENRPGQVVVYNFSVEQHQTYVAEGRVVHNCHHVPANSFLEIIDRCPARFRWGFTATPTRADGQGFLLDMIFGQCLFTMTAKELIDMGFLLRPTIIPVQTGWSPTKEHYRWNVKCGVCGGINETGWVSWKDTQTSICGNRIVETGPRGGQNRRKCGEILPPHADASRSVLDWAVTLTALSDNAGRIDLIAKLGSWVLRSKRRLLVLMARKGAAVTTCTVLRGVGLRTSTVSADVADREGRIRALRIGACDALTATSLADEGLDVPELDTVISANPGKDGGKAQQRAGRACRPAGKPPIIFDLVDDHGIFRKHWTERRTAYIEAYGRECIASFEPVSWEEALRIAGRI